MWTFTAALVLAALPTSGLAQQVSDTRLRELMAQAAQRVASGDLDPQQTSRAPGEARPTLRLTLDEAVKFALDRNLDIAVQRLNPQINDIAVLSVKSVYNPTLTSTVGPQSSTILPSSQTQLGSSGAAVTETMTFNGGIAQSLPWGGGNFSAALNNFRRSSTSNNSLFNPLFQSAWSFAYNQPILRNFSIDSTRQQLAVTKLNRDVSDVQLRATITNTLSNVRNAYWDYVFAVQSVDVAQKSVDLAMKLVQDNQTRVEVGTMAPIDVVQAQSQAATARQNLAAAQQTMRTAELVLKRLIVSGTEDPNWSVTLDPVDRPEFAPQAIDLEAALRNALSQRTDLEIAKKSIRQRCHAPVPPRPAQTAGRPVGQLRAAGAGRDAAQSSIKRHARQHYHEHGSRRHRRRVQLAVPQRLPSVDGAGELLVSAGHQLPGGLGRPRPGSDESGAGTSQASGIAGRHRCDQRGRERPQQRRAGGGCAGSP
jgi:outer membrane protein TolC